MGSKNSLTRAISLTALHRGLSTVIADVRYKHERYGVVCGSKEKLVAVILSPDDYDELLAGKVTRDLKETAGALIS